MLIGMDKADDGEPLVKVVLIQPDESGYVSQSFSSTLARHYALILIQWADLLDANKQDEETK